MAYTGFDKLKGQLAQRSGVTDPGALAAFIGRKKYGAGAMDKAAASHHSLKGKQPKGKRTAAHNAKIAMFVKGQRG